MKWPLWMQRTVVFLNTGDNSVLVGGLALTPLFVVVIIGMVGAP